MTKAQIQVLIDAIDTTGSQGTTGQELKTIFEAFKNEAYEYFEVELSDTQLKNLHTYPPVDLLPFSAVGKYWDIKKIIIEFEAGNIPYAGATQIAIEKLDLDSQQGILRIDLNGIINNSTRRTHKVIHDPSFEYFSTPIFMNETGFGTDQDSYVIVNNGPAFVNGNGTMLFKIWATERTQGTEI